MTDWQREPYGQRNEQPTQEQPVVVERRVESSFATPPPAPAAPQVNVNAPPTQGYFAAPSEERGWRAKRAVWFILGLLIALLALRMVLLLLGANQENAIVGAIMAITELFVLPFYGIFSFDRVQATGNNVFEFAALVAIIGWGLLGLLLTAIISLTDRNKV